MWGAVTNVTTGVTLVAFLAAVALSAYRFYLSGRAKVIQSLPAEARADALKTELNSFGVDAKNLTKDQQFQIAMREIELRRTRIYFITLVSIFVTVVSGLLALLLPLMESKKTPPSAPSVSNNPVDTATLDRKRDTKGPALPAHKRGAPELPRIVLKVDSSADPVTWEKNYAALRPTNIGMGSSTPNECKYNRWGHRGSYVRALNALNLTSAPEIAAVRNKLLSEVNNMPSSCGNDGEYDLAISPAMSDLQEELQADIRAKIIENRGHMPD